MRVFISKELYIWLLVNAILPILVPFCIILLLKLPLKINMNGMEILEMLWKGGAYIFLGLFVLVSLLPHFLIQTKISTGLIVTYFSIIIILLLITCFLYISYLSVVPSEYAVPFAENLRLSIYVTIGGIVIAIAFKAYFLNKIDFKLNEETMTRIDSRDRKNTQTIII